MSWEESSGLRDTKPTTTTPSRERGNDGVGGGGFEEEEDEGEEVGTGDGGGRVKTRIEGGLGESIIERTKKGNTKNGLLCGF